MEISNSKGTSPIKKMCVCVCMCVCVQVIWAMDKRKHVFIAGVP